MTWIIFVLSFAVAASALYDNRSPVVQLTPGTFDSEVLQHKGVYFVEFFAPWCGHCKNLAPEWEKAAQALQGIVRVGAVDADKHRELGQRFKVEGFPTIYVFGADKTKPALYQGGRSAKEIVAEALKFSQTLANDRLGIKSGGSSSGSSNDGPTHVVDLSDDDFESKVLESDDLWLVEFFAPWCGHCKNLAPEWKRAASQLLGTVKLGAVDATKHTSLASKYNVRSYPTIIFLGRDKTKPQEYDGGRTETAIVAWALEKYDKFGPPIVIPEVTSNEQFKKECLDKKKVCVAFALPPIFDTNAEERQKTLTVLAEVAKKTRTISAAFVWFSGGSQPKFEDAFRLTMNYPTFVALSPAKMRFATHRGAFTTINIADEIQKIADGRMGTYEIKGGIPDLETTQAWDGKDYVAPSDD